MRTFVAISLLVLIAQSIEGHNIRGHRKLKRALNENARIPNEYIVVFSSQAFSNDFQAQSMIDVVDRNTNGEAIVTKEYHSAFHAVSVSNLSPSGLQSLLDNFFVEYIEENQMLYEQSTQESAPYNLDRIDQPDRPLDGEYHSEGSGSGIDVYIMDSGIHTSHNEFGGRAICGMDAVNEGGKSNCFDGSGHGTHVAGTIGGLTYGVAKNANLVGVKVLDKNGGGSLAHVLEGLDYVISRTSLASDKRSIVNMSLGGAKINSLNNAIDKAFQQGVITVVSAGNGSTDACEITPASAETSISVGALEKDADKMSWYSNYGACVDIFAPGDDVESATSSGNSVTELRTGTSMAGPLVAGVVALLMEKYPSADVQAIRDLLLISGSLENKIQGDIKGSPNLILSTIKMNEPPFGEQGGEEPLCAGVSGKCLVDEDCCGEGYCHLRNNGNLRCKID